MSHSLKHFTSLLITGPDAAKFLQGQLSCDINKLAEDQLHLALHCNPKGRVIASMLVLLQEKSYRLIIDTSIAEVLLATLQKYALFSKVTLTIDDAAIYGIKTIDDNCYPLPYVAEYALTFDDNLSTDYYDSTAWWQNDIRHGIANIVADTSGLFLPHDINAHETSAIDFDKGCYTGQEIIARMHYRGKLKNHLYRLQITAEKLPQPSDALSDESAKTLGYIVNCAQSDENTFLALAVLNEKTYQQTDTLYLVDHNNLKLSIKFFNGGQDKSNNASS